MTLIRVPGGQSHHTPRLALSIAQCIGQVPDLQVLGPEVVRRDARHAGRDETQAEIGVLVISVVELFLLWLPARVRQCETTPCLKLWRTNRGLKRRAARRAPTNQKRGGEERRPHTSNVESSATRG